ncbi:unannotated protein [freshwater metagenome]|jgi:hypothetical protein|uniref:Unannotated protein n=1 Tax=freshwater metagenome TaxID=449393 RepID=A0A6J6XFA3_9ZZZZ
MSRYERNGQEKDKTNKPFSHALKVKGALEEIEEARQ